MSDRRMVSSTQSPVKPPIFLLWPEHWTAVDIGIEGSWVPASTAILSERGRCSERGGITSEGAPPPPRPTHTHTPVVDEPEEVLRLLADKSVFQSQIPAFESCGNPPHGCEAWGICLFQATGGNHFWSVRVGQLSLCARVFFLSLGPCWRCFPFRHFHVSEVRRVLTTTDV